MNTKQALKKAVKENPDIELVLEISARARETEQREPAKELRPSTDVGMNPTTAQGIVYSGCVLSDERNLIS
jgi:hypothetical protein